MDAYDTYVAPVDPYRTRRNALLVGAALAGLVATLVGAFALLSSLVNTHGPDYRCIGAENDDACLSQTQLAQPFHLDTTLWAFALAAAICAMVLTMALLAQPKRPV